MVHIDINSIQFNLLHSNHGMVQEVHETYLHIYNNKYRGQTDKELGEQIILLIFIIKRHNFLRIFGFLDDIRSENFLVFGAEQNFISKNSLRNLLNDLHSRI